MSDEDNHPNDDRQPGNPEPASNAASPPRNDDPEPPPKCRRGRPKLRVIDPGDRQSENEPEPEPDDPEPDDDEDPVARPASPGRKAQWRVKAFVNSMYRDPNFPWPYVEWRRKPLKDKSVVTDVGDDENRMAALALAGICDLTYDHADGSFKYRTYRPDAPPPPEEILKLPWRSFTDMPEEDRASLVSKALFLMGSTPQAQLTQAHKWNSAFACLKSVARQVDSIHDEMLALIEKGEARLKADPSLMRTCRPGRLLFNAFPYKPRLRYSEAKFAVLVGRCMMRDMTALARRPAYGRPPLTPQLMPTLADPEEGNGKSSFCRVLGGGAVGDDGGRGRYTDAINVAMIVGNVSHGQHTLLACCGGKTVAEWADKNLGTLNETQSGTLRAFINSGVMRSRRMGKDAFRLINWRALNIVTTNNQEVLTQFSGIRRLPIVDLEQWRKRRTTGPEVIRQNHNSGLDWLAAHRDVILTLAFRVGDWRGTLAPPDALLKLMKERAADHTRQENWQLLLKQALDLATASRYSSPDGQQPATADAGRVAGITPGVLAQWTNETIRGGKQPTPTAVGRHMGNLGWVHHVRRVRGARRSVSERMWVWEDEVAKATREQREQREQHEQREQREQATRKRSEDDTIQVTDMFVNNTFTQGHFTCCPVDGYDEEKKTNKSASGDSNNNEPASGDDPDTPF
jgi:hypothetical protein